MSFNPLAYRRQWMKDYRSPHQKQQNRTKLINQGKCTVCEILLTSVYHTNCPGLSPPFVAQNNGQDPKEPHTDN